MKRSGNPQIINSHDESESHMFSCGTNTPEPEAPPLRWHLRQSLPTSIIRNLFWMATAGMLLVSSLYAAPMREEQSVYDAACLEVAEALNAYRTSTIGKGVANATGTGQVMAMAARGKRTLYGKIGIGTLGSGASSISLTGPMGNRRYTINYHLGGNVTAALISGRLTTSAGVDGALLEALASPRRGSKGSPARTRIPSLPIRGSSLGIRGGSDLVILRTSRSSK